MDSLAVWFLVSLFLKTSFSSCPESNDYDVLIFGAGAAGVTAARILHDNGVTNIKILEAYSKIGGRIRSKSFGNVQIEVGANWIHEAPPQLMDQRKRNGQRNDVNPIYTLALAREGVCAVKNQVALSGIYTVDSSFMDEVNDRYEEVNATANVDLMDYMNKYENAKKNYSENIMITVREALTNEGWDPNTTLKQLVEWSEFDFTYGTTPQDSSLNLTAENDNVQFGDSCYIVTDQRGFASVLQCLAEPFNDTISLEAEVNSIDWNEKCVCAQVTGQGRMCADYGIVTFSIGVLQSWLNNNSFNSSLSSGKRNAIENSKMGLYLKIFVKFPRTFWETNAHYIYFTNQKRGYYPVIQPIGAALSREPPIMLMTVTGDEAKRLSALTKDQIKNEILIVLRDRYRNIVIPDISVDDIEYHDWFTDEFFLGMFSNNPTTLTLDDKKNLAEPEGRLYFSGEANSIEHGGTIHGAYCSGIDVATDILGRKGINEDRSSIPKCIVEEEPPSPSAPACGSCNRRQSTKEIADCQCPSSAINIRVSLLLTLLSTLMVSTALMIFSV